MQKKIVKKYAELMHQAQQATGRKEAVGLIHKAAKLKTKFDKLRDDVIIYKAIFPNKNVILK